MSKSKNSKKGKFNNVEVSTEEQYIKAIYGMEFIAGVTENGVPYGTFIDEDNDNNELIFRNISVDSDNELPF